MKASLAAIFRHPVKGIGSEAIDRAELTVGRPLSGDRAWAVLTGKSQDVGSWQPRNRFAQGASAPSLAAVRVATRGPRLGFTHPERPPLEIDLASEGDALVEWIVPLCPADRPVPTRVVAAPTAGMSDSDYPSVTIAGTASLAAFGAAAGCMVDPRRFRCNLWIDGSEPFAELDWVGRQIELGDAVFEIVERTGRCRLTEADPMTGRRDLDSLGILRQHFGHQDFGVTARVVRGGTVSIADVTQ